LAAALLLAGCRSPGGPPVLDQLRPVEGERAPEGNVTLAVEPEDAEVAVDGVTQGLARDFDGKAGALRLSPGPHQLRLTRSGFHPMELTVFAPEEGRQQLNAHLDKQ
jgi:hypothetical protein